MTFADNIRRIDSLSPTDPSLTAKSIDALSRDVRKYVDLMSPAQVQKLFDCLSGVMISTDDVDLHMSYFPTVLWPKSIIDYYSMDSGKMHRFEVICNRQFDRILDPPANIISPFKRVFKAEVDSPFVHRAIEEFASAYDWYSLKDYWRLAFNHSAMSERTVRSITSLRSGDTILAELAVNSELLVPADIINAKILDDSCDAGARLASARAIKPGNITQELFEWVVEKEFDRDSDDAVANLARRRLDEALAGSQLPILFEMHNTAADIYVAGLNESDLHNVDFLEMPLRAMPSGSRASDTSLLRASADINARRNI